MSATLLVKTQAMANLTEGEAKQQLKQKSMVMLQAKYSKSRITVGATEDWTESKDNTLRPLTKVVRDPEAMAPTRG